MVILKKKTLFFYILPNRQVDSMSTAAVLFVFFKEEL